MTLGQIYGKDYGYLTTQQDWSNGFNVSDLVYPYLLVVFVVSYQSDRRLTVTNQVANENK